MEIGKTHPICQLLSSISHLSPTSRTEWLSIAKLHHVAIRVADAAVIAHGIGFLARLPDQGSRLTCLGGDGIDGRPALHGKAQVAIVIGGLGFAPSTWDQHKNEFVLPPGFRQPDHTSAIGDTLMHELHAAVRTVKGYRGLEVTHM